MRSYVQPVLRIGPLRPDGAETLAGTDLWFDEALRLSRTHPPERIPAFALSTEERIALTAPRAPIAGMDMSRPHVMGILNVTPDSFSDGGKHDAPARASAAGKRMLEQGASILDVGGESTRPGAEPVPVEAEIARIEPVIRALRHNRDVPISIDTRKSAVADVALTAGARLINDVSGFTYDPGLAQFAADMQVPVCVMHARGDPQTMQNDPRYDDVLLDVYDFLDAQVAHLTALGIKRSAILVDPGIGFGKTIAHNLTLLNGLSLFHSLGCGLLVGASRKGFIGRITGVQDPADRLGGSIAVALAAASQGAQVLRVHDVNDTVQALKLWTATQKGAWDGA